MRTVQNCTDWKFMRCYIQRRPRVCFYRKPSPPSIFASVYWQLPALRNELSRNEGEKLMRKLKFTRVWIPAFLLAGLLTGCGDSDPNVGKPGNPLTPPAVTSVNPLTGSTFTCGNPVVINATFTKAMNPATINTTTFTLATGATSVAGV